jgi:hypothetical protein
MKPTPHTPINILLAGSQRLRERTRIKRGAQRGSKAASAVRSTRSQRGSALSTGPGPRVERGEQVQGTGPLVFVLDAHRLRGLCRRRRRRREARTRLDRGLLVELVTTSPATLGTRSCDPRDPFLRPRSTASVPSGLGSDDDVEDEAEDEG